VKGRAAAKISEDIQKNLPIMEAINMKYLGTLEHPLAKMLMENTRNGIGDYTKILLSMGFWQGYVIRMIARLRSES